jgi:hypothetical protein
MPSYFNDDCQTHKVIFSHAKVNVWIVWKNVAFELGMVACL